MHVVSFLVCDHQCFRTLLPPPAPGRGAVGGPAYMGTGSSQSGANVREQERAVMTDGSLTWKTCPLFGVQQSADDRYYFITQRLKRGWW